MNVTWRPYWPLEPFWGWNRFSPTHREVGLYLMRMEIGRVFKDDGTLNDLHTVQIVGALWCFRGTIGIRIRTPIK